jgi:chromosome segregation ATPase
MFITDVYYRELKQKISELQQELDALNSSYVDLENSYIDLKNNLNALNSSYIDLKNNYTALNSTYYEKLRELESSKGELGAVRQLAIIFGVTTTFFVITTLYLFKRRPGQIW